MTLLLQCGVSCHASSVQSFLKITFYSNLSPSFIFRRTSLSLLMVHAPTLQPNINLEAYLNPVTPMERQRAQCGYILPVSFGLTGPPNTPVSDGSTSVSSFLGISITSQLLSGDILYVFTCIIAQPPWRKEPAVKMKEISEDTIRKNKRLVSPSQFQFS